MGKQTRLSLTILRVTYFWYSPSKARNTLHRGSFLLLASRLAGDNLSDDKEEGRGGTFTAESFDTLSEEMRLRSDCSEGVLDSLSSVSLLFFCKIALSGLLFVRGCEDRGGGKLRVASELRLTSGSSKVENLDERVDLASGEASIGSEEARDVDCFLSGETLCSFPSFFASLAEGEGDLEDGALHDRLAKVRNVLETERLTENLGGSEVSISDCGLVLSPSIALVRSSVDKVNLVTATLPFPPVEVLRSSSLLGTYGDPPALGDPSGEKASTLSENVRLMPSLGAESCVSGRCV